MRNSKNTPEHVRRETSDRRNDQSPERAVGGEGHELEALECLLPVPGALDNLILAYLLDRAAADESRAPITGGDGG